ncbi:hypothetical protein ZEAMMB73_Zm00001d037474 [Zea mays]|uniref:Uncharacterized protein n=1 Tax=Zea mays TaxID=4577 RepID=A0A1D6LY51_MAIZE|nr:hypothetical protein ZEAMMB73_Zm00001d037474 [Zea mays]
MSRSVAVQLQSTRRLHLDRVPHPSPPWVLTGGCDAFRTAHEVAEVLRVQLAEVDGRVVALEAELDILRHRSSQLLD